jgi:hypothetical protein
MRLCGSRDVGNHLRAQAHSPLEEEEEQALEETVFSSLCESLDARQLLDVSYMMMS